MREINQVPAMICFISYVLLVLVFIFTFLENMNFLLCYIFLDLTEKLDKFNEMVKEIHGFIVCPEKDQDPVFRLGSVTDEAYFAFMTVNNIIF